ncbi:hypothetical protein LTV02_15025 [Nocardia yamanashiensis]|uniref:hypothetical protein n=1 Tax=Nocardia yamanashiensis TaxID=209247 RepID=UPI0008347933|nr:hypothetical protein [Nocardia yamanashiensis]UGT44617.1 hypothetical protein LTV02_15025 [Nocardia yamanashiensis]
MTTWDIVVTVGEEDRLVLMEAADAAGMGLEAYLSWCVRILAMQARPGSGKQHNLPGQARPGRPAPEDDESEAAAWAETFSQRLSHRADRKPEI